MFVHAACEGLVAHSHALLGEHGLSWFDRLFAHGYHPERVAFDRGFVRPLALVEGSPLWREPELFRMSPIVYRLGEWIDSQPWAGTYRATRVTVAGDRGDVMIRLPAIRNSGRELLAREQDLLARFSHPSLIRVLDVTQTRDGLALVLPPARGPLELGVAPAIAAAIGAQLAGAVAEIHRCGVVHGRISLETIRRGDVPLLDNFATALCDVDQIEFDDVTWDYPRGTWLCLAPEQVNGADPSRPADVWAVAMVVTALALGRHPVSGRDMFEAIGRTRELAFERIDPATPLGQVLAGVLVEDPSRRPSPALLAEYFARVASA